MDGFDIIVAADEQGGIARAGALPWHLPGDLAWFRELSVGDGDDAVLMGRKTWDALGAHERPLPRRLNIVLTRAEGLSLPPGVLRAATFEEGLRLAGGRLVHVVGGGEIYARALPHPDCRRVYLTRVRGDFGCDTFFPPLDEGWRLADLSELHEENGIAYDFACYWRTAAGES